MQAIKFPMLLKLVVKTGVLLTTALIVRNNIKKKHDPAKHNKVLEILDDDELEGEAEECANAIAGVSLDNQMSGKVFREHTFRVAKSLANEARCKMGPQPRPTEANRLVAWELCMKEAIARDIRKIDRLRFVTHAVDLVFIPNADDVFMSRVRHSATVAERLKQIEPRRPNRIMRLLGIGSSDEGLSYRKT